MTVYPYRPDAPPPQVEERIACFGQLKRAAVQRRTTRGPGRIRHPSGLVERRRIDFPGGEFLAVQRHLFRDALEVIHEMRSEVDAAQVEHEDVERLPRLQIDFNLALPLAAIQRAESPLALQNHGVIAGFGDFECSFRGAIDARAVENQAVR